MKAARSSAATANFNDRWQKSLDDYFLDLFPNLSRGGGHQGLRKALIVDQFDDIQDQLDGVIEVILWLRCAHTNELPCERVDNGREARRLTPKTPTPTGRNMLTATTPGGSVMEVAYTSFTDYGWVKIADSDAVKALLDAARAKTPPMAASRIFTSQPIYSLRRGRPVGQRDISGHALP